MGYPDNWDRIRKRVYQRDDYRCQGCGARGGYGGDTQLHAHHIVPVSEGGSHDLSNLKTVCHDCHEDIHGHGVGGAQDTGPIASEEKTLMGWSTVALVCALLGVVFPPLLLLSFFALYKTWKGVGDRPSPMTLRREE